MHARLASLVETPTHDAAVPTPVPSPTGPLHQVRDVAETVSSAGLALLTCAALVAGVALLVQVLRIRRRYQVVVPPLVNATGLVALDGPVGEGATALLRERLHRDVPVVRAWCRGLLPDSTTSARVWDDQRLALEELLAGQPSVPREAVDQSAQNW